MQSADTTSAPDNSRFFVLALGLLVGFVIGFVVLLANLPVDQSTVDFNASPVAGQSGDSARTNFEFYTVLADSDDDAENPAGGTLPREAASATGSSSVVSGSQGAPRQLVAASARPATGTSAEALARATAGPDAIPVEAPASVATAPASRAVTGDSRAAVPATSSRTGNAEATYFLQAGSFREAQSAERMRASVLLLGLEAFIVTRPEPDGVLGHRVRIGPFHDRDRLTDAKLRLRRGDVAYEIVRVTG